MESVVVNKKSSTTRATPASGTTSATPKNNKIKMNFRSNRNDNCFTANLWHVNEAIEQK